MKLTARDIPYGISDFRRIRNDGRYYIDKSKYISDLEMVSDFMLFPERVYHGDIKHSYIIELKHSKPDASDAELAAKREEGIAQLRRYAADPLVPKLAEGADLHVILYQFKGKEICRLEEVK